MSLEQSSGRSFDEKLPELFSPDRLFALRNESQGDGKESPQARELITPKEQGPLLLSAVHYVSPSLGKWFRALLGMHHAGKVLDVRPLELAQHDAAYEEVPRDINIPVWKDFRRPLIVELGNEVPSLTPEEDIDFIHINATLWNDLKQGFIEQKGAKEFYSIVIGHDPVDATEWARSSRQALAKILEQLDHIRTLQTKSLLGGKARMPASLGESEQLVLWRTLLFSLFLSIRTKESTPVYTLILPIYECESLGTAADALVPRLGTFVGCFNKRLTTAGDLRKDIGIVRDLLLPAMRALAILELHVLESRGAGNVVVIENIIRSCAIVDKKVQAEVNLYGRYLLKHLGHLINGKDESDLPAPLRDVLQMTGANKVMRDTLDSIMQLVKGGLNDDGYREGVTVFLHSEPGCGKENLASLCHLFSPRVLVLPTTTSAELRRLGKILGNLKITVGKWKGQELFAGKGEELQLAIADYLRHLGPGDDEELLRCYKVFVEIILAWPHLGYVFFNCGNLEKENASDLLYGSEEEPGLIYRAHKFAGTAFLDEVNTLDRGIANRLLRVLAKPHQVTVRTGASGEQHREEFVNVQVVFGSNRSPEQLLADGFSSAFVYRIAPRSFRIPPLRERKEDIAIFVNQRVLRRQREAMPETDENVLASVRRISLDGLRLLCELQWPDNYRGLKGLVDDLLEERIQRKISDPEISFDEVIRVVSRREAMGRAGSQSNSGSGFRILMDTP
jgi:DNA-binding NtrC family response regulator